MKLPSDTIIAREKITRYLLIRQNRGDKSAFLEKGGYSLANPDALISSLVALRDENEEVQIAWNRFGRYYEIIGTLRGPFRIELSVRTIWMTEHLSGITKFITLIPVRAIQR
jgi:hypothetical protein